MPTTVKNTALTQTQKRFIKSLSENPVKYLVIGGYAVKFHGHLRLTRNLDKHRR